MCRLCRARPAAGRRAVCGKCHYATYTKRWRKRAEIRIIRALASYERHHGVTKPTLPTMAGVRRIMVATDNTCAITRVRLPMEDLRLRRKDVTVPFSYPDNCVVVAKYIRNHERLLAAARAANF